MADDVFNIALGRVNQYQGRVANNDPGTATLSIVLLQAAEADAVLQDYADLGTLLAAGGNTECDFTNYARVVYTDSDVGEPSPDNTNDWQEADFPDPTWTNAGGASNNSVVKLLVCYDPTGGADNTLIPLTFHDFVATTDGNDLIGQVSANGYYRAA